MIHDIVIVSVRDTESLILAMKSAYETVIKDKQNFTASFEAIKADSLDFPSNLKALVLKALKVNCMNDYDVSSFTRSSVEDLSYCKNVKRYDSAKPTKHQRQSSTVCRGRTFSSIHFKNNLQDSEDSPRDSAALAHSPGVACVQLSPQPCQLDFNNEKLDFRELVMDRYILVVEVRLTL